MAKSLDELNEHGLTLKHPNGRTIREAIEAGDWYVVEASDGAMLYMPGCAGILETLAAARLNWPDRKGQYVRLNRVLPGSVIGCMILEDSDRGAVL